MSDDLDPVLRARLDRLARAVPVPPERAVRPVVSIAPRWRDRSSSSGPGALAAAALVLVVIFAAAYVGGGRNDPSGVSDSITAGDFRLTLRSPTGRYAAQEPIEVSAILEYLGEDPSIKVYSHPGMPGFGVEQLDGPYRADPGSRSSCATYEFRRGEPVSFPFAKSGGLVPGAADFEFMREYLNVTDGRPDPVLRLPAGTWRIFAIADFGLGDCGPVHYDLEVGITVVVGASAPTTAPSSATPSSASPSPVATPSPTPTVAPSPTMPPPQVAVPYPDGCAAYGLSDRRCAYIVEWAREQAGIGADAPVTVELLGDPDCEEPDQRACGVIRTMDFIVRIRLTTPTGASSDHPLFCGLGGESSLLCTDRPRIQIGSPMNGYTDVPCSGEAPESPCATPLPTIEPAAAAAAVPLNVAAIDIPIDHVGAYSIPVGEAVLPNGILSGVEFRLVDDRPTDVLVAPYGISLTITSLDGGPKFENYYQRGWHPGTERVQATLTFSIEWFEPGAVLRVRDIRVH